MNKEEGDNPSASNLSWRHNSNGQFRIWLALVGALLAQAASPKLPATAADVGAWDAVIVRRAAALIPAPARWDRASTGDCPAHATSVSLICALQQASDEAGARQLRSPIAGFTRRPVDGRAAAGGFLVKRRSFR